LNYELLKQLCETPSVAGRESRISDFIKKSVKDFFDEIEIDPLGSLICKKFSKQKNKQKILLLCHMDEIGFLVSHINNKGFLFVDPVGGFDPRNLFSRRVLVCTDSGDYKAVMNPQGKPVHTQSAMDRKKIPEPNEFFIDMGIGEKTKDIVKIGDFVVMDEPFLELSDKIVSKALDNRIACWLGMEIAKYIHETKLELDSDLYIVFTSQEEVGLRGAKTASFKVNPDIAIGIDTTLACDTPGVSEQDWITTHGKGFGLHIKDSSFISDNELVKEFVELAEENKITYQRTILSRGGQDGAAGQQSGSGAKAIGIVVGTRYIHTVTEMIDKSDLESALSILKKYIENK
jgi:tetrahedral aminopeptidase|tara:strand:- start:390 stop:1427 length:1038 start_codon:yes stop_codon:yes gene_type:complete